MTSPIGAIHEALDEGPAPAAAVEGRSPFQLAWARVRRDRVALLALAFLVIMIVVAVGAPVIADLTGHGRDEQLRTTGLRTDDFGFSFPVGPSAGFLLGADQLGRDILVRLAYGARISLFVGIVATAVALFIGTTVGLVSGYFSGRVDAVTARVIDIFLSFPFLVTALTMVALNRNSRGDDRVSNLVIVIVIISFFTWTFFARLVRGQVLALREREFIEAARSLGAGNLRIMLRDVLPNLTAPLLVFVTVQIPLNIVLEATLSFLGAGVKIPTPSWGNMISDSQGLYTKAPWFLLAPGFALLLTVLAFNLLGDSLRDALDPRAARTMAKG